MIPYNVLNACDYNELYKNIKIFSIDQLDSKIMIKLPNNCSKVMLYQMINISHSDTQEDVFIGEIDREPGRLWLDVKLHLLDLSSGKHMYKLKFTDEDNRYHPTVYFAYVIQDDNPITPYIYMKGRGNNPDIEKKPDTPKPKPKHVDYEIVSSEPFIHLDEGSDAVLYLTSMKDNQEFDEHYTYTVSSKYNVIVTIHGRCVHIHGVRHGNCGITFHGDFSQKSLKVNVEVHPVDYTMEVSTKRLVVQLGQTSSFTAKSTVNGQPLEEDYELINSNPSCFDCVNNRGVIAVTGILPGTGVITVIGETTGEDYSKDVNIVISGTLEPEIVTSVDGFGLNLNSSTSIVISTQKGNQVIQEDYIVQHIGEVAYIDYVLEGNTITAIGIRPGKGSIRVSGLTSGATKDIEYVVTS